MSTSEPEHITQAICLARKIQGLESRKHILIKEREAYDFLISSIDRELKELWIKVIELKHSIGEAVDEVSLTAAGQ